MDNTKLVNDFLYTPLLIGGSGGSLSARVATDLRTFFRRISKIEVWAGESSLHGVKLTFGHDSGDITTVLLGRENGSKKEASFAYDELFTEFSLWGNGIGTRSGGITIKTNKGKNFHHRMTKWSLRTEYKARSVESGICCGWYARHGNDIDAFGLTFLKRVHSVENKIKPVGPKAVGNWEELYRNTYSNVNGSNNKWSISKSFSKTNTIQASITRSQTHSFGASLSYSSPEIASLWGGKLTATLTYGFSNTSSSSNSKSYTEGTTISANQSGDIPRGKKVLAVVKTRRVHFDSRYEGQAHVRMTTGHTFTYNISGIFNSVNFGQGIIEARVIN